VVQLIKTSILESGAASAKTTTSCINTTDPLTGGTELSAEIQGSGSKGEWA